MWTSCHQTTPYFKNNQYQGDPLAQTRKDATYNKRLQQNSFERSSFKTSHLIGW